jgi:hypothetical protein
MRQQSVRIPIKATTRVSIKQAGYISATSEIHRTQSHLRPAAGPYISLHSAAIILSKMKSQWGLISPIGTWTATLLSGLHEVGSGQERIEVYVETFGLLSNIGSLQS